MDPSIQQEACIISGGGTNSTATPNSGGVVYGDGSAHQFTAAGNTG
jgi:hypothetical protein